MKTDDSGMLLGFPLHDSQLVSVFYEESCCHLNFKKESSCCLIKLTGISYSGFQCFKFNAVLSEIFSWRVREVPPEIADMEDGAWRTLLCDIPVGMAMDSTIESLLCTRGDSLLVQFNFSYGGSFALICDEMSVAQGVAENN
jgi:hypothetical protein